MNVQEKLIQLRKSKGMSQEDLAEKIMVSRQAISRWENGTALPDATNILALSKLYGVTTDYLLNDHYESDDDLPKVKENKTVLHNNLTLIAIIVQAAACQKYKNRIGILPVPSRNYDNLLHCTPEWFGSTAYHDGIADLCFCYQSQIYEPQAGEKEITVWRKAPRN